MNNAHLHNLIWPYHLMSQISMKRILLAAIVSVILFTSQAQFHVTLNTGPAFPQGAFYDDYVLGFGASIAPEYSISPSVDIGILAGYTGFSSNVVGRSSIDLLTIRPTLLTGKYYLTKSKLSLYLSARWGWYAIQTPDISIGGIPISTKQNASDDAISAGAGLYFGRLHFGGTLHMIENRNYVQLHVGVRIGSRRKGERKEKEELSPFPPDYELDYLLDNSENEK